MDRKAELTCDMLDGSSSFLSMGWGTFSYTSKQADYALYKSLNSESCTENLKL